MSDQFAEGTSWTNPEPADIGKILRGAKTIAVVGLSSKQDRASNRVSRYLIERGFEIIPVNPREAEILGKKSYPDLASIGRKVDIVDVFRKGETTPPITEEAVKIGAGCIWLQEGVISQESYDISTRAGVPIVMNRCVLKEHQRLEL